MSVLFNSSKNPGTSSRHARKSNASAKGLMNSFNVRPGLILDNKTKINDASDTYDCLDVLLEIVGHVGGQVLSAVVQLRGPVEDLQITTQITLGIFSQRNIIYKLEVSFHQFFYTP